MTVTQRVTTMIRDLRIDAESIPAQFNKWLTGLSTVPFQALISALLALGTAAVYWTALLKEINIDNTSFGMWLAFVAAYGGIAYRQFAKKRDTYDPTIPSKQNTEGAPPNPDGGRVG